MARETSAKSASGAMIGIASVACPDDDGTRNASGMLTMNITIANSPPTARTPRLPASSDGVGDAGVVHHHGYAAGQCDDQRRTHEVAHAGHDRADHALLAEFADRGR